MIWHHPELPGRRLRLAYCLNLHPAEDLAGVLEGMRRVTLPLRDRLAAPGEPFGVGLYLPAALALRLAAAEGRDDLERLAEFLSAEALDPFTFNAFPYGGFHRAGLKRRVFEPTWSDTERFEFTLGVARVAGRLAAGRAEGHVSISTHPGRFGAWAPGEWEAARSAWARCCEALGEIEERTGTRVVLSVEAEPRASAGDTRQLAELLRDARASAPEPARARVARHLGACLDCCHSAVEFEEPGEALELATLDGAPLGKLQFSSALTLAAPGRDDAGRAALLGMDEERYLHQVTGRRGAELLRVADLPELATQLAGSGGAAWRACDEWRCHFHVPVDLAAVGSSLTTTRAHAERLLALFTAAPERWGSDELHVEIETYTWDVLPGAVRGPGALADGLEREYRHVLALLETAGWSRPGSPPRRPAAAPRKGPGDVDTPGGDR